MDISLLSIYLEQHMFSIGIVAAFLFFLLPTTLKYLIKSKVKEESDLKKIINILRSFMLLLFLVFVVKDFIFTGKELEGTAFYISKFLAIAFIIQVSYSSYSIIEYFIELNTNSRVLKSRRAVWKFILKISFIILTLIIILNVSGLADKFGITALIGVIGVFLGLTSGVWFPSIKSGIVLLLSKYISEEDIIEVPELGIYGVVNSIGVMSTIIRNEIDNHRIIVSNEKLEGSVINNLSQLAKVGGLREILRFNIGYIKPDGKQITPKECRDFFYSAFERAKVSKLIININFKKDIEIFLDNPGDHALEWKLFYYTDNVNSRIKDRAHLYEVFLEESIKCGISLSTPTTHSMEISNIQEIKKETLKNKDFLKVKGV